MINVINILAQALSQDTFKSTPSFILDFITVPQVLKYQFPVIMKVGEASLDSKSRGQASIFLLNVEKLFSKIFFNQLDFQKNQKKLFFEFLSKCQRRNTFLSNSSKRPIFFYKTTIYRFGDTFSKTQFLLTS